MDTSTQDHTRLREAVTACLNDHDPLGILDLGAPADEYDSEMEDVVRLLAAGTPVTPDVVAAVWHKSFGDSPEVPGQQTAELCALAVDLQALSALADR
jgi:hypothetical protein